MLRGIWSLTLQVALENDSFLVEQMLKESLCWITLGGEHTTVSLVSSPIILVN